MSFCFVILTKHLLRSQQCDLVAAMIGRRSKTSMAGIILDLLCLCICMYAILDLYNLSRNWNMVCSAPLVVVKLCGMVWVRGLEDMALLALSTSFLWIGQMNK